MTNEFIVFALLMLTFCTVFIILAIVLAKEEHSDSSNPITPKLNGNSYKENEPNNDEIDSSSEFSSYRNYFKRRSCKNKNKGEIIKTNIKKTYFNKKHIQCEYCQSWSLLDDSNIYCRCKSCGAGLKL